MPQRGSFLGAVLTGALLVVLTAPGGWSQERVLTTPTPGWSAEGIRAGDFRIHPSLGLSVEWNDNVNLAPRDETADSLYLISPGVLFELPGRQYAFRLGYLADILRYREQNQLDETHHTILADAKAAFPGGLTFILSDEFKRTSDFAGFPVPELTQRVERNENNLHVGGEYQLRERFALGLDYTFFWVDYLPHGFDQLDRQEHIVGGTLYYRIAPKTSLLGEYNYQANRYRLEGVAEVRDSDSNKVKVGIKGDPTAKTTLLAKVGWEVRNYKNPAREDWDGLIVEVEALYTYREPSQLRVFGGREPIESSFAGKEFYVATFGGAEIRHQLGSRWLVKLGGLIGVNDYPERVITDIKKRADRFFAIAPSIRYQIRQWLALEAGYFFLLRDSNFDDFDYRNNRVRGSILMTF